MGLTQMRQIAENIDIQHKQKIEELIEFAKLCPYVLKPPKGLLWKRCPYCKHKLMLIKHSAHPLRMSSLQYWEWVCPENDYRFVKERYFW